MSLIGLDIGSSAVKGVACAEDGAVLARRRVPVPASHSQAGWWQVEAEDVATAAMTVLRGLADDPAVRDDQPHALATSASGREVFLADDGGAPLTPCLMAGDVRGAEVANRLREQAPPETWLQRCGHLPEPMDPVVRVLWWQEREPELAARASRVLGWHELMTLRLTGHAVVDASLASRWLDFDLTSGDWTRASGALEPALLPPVRRWGSFAGELQPQPAEATGLPPGLPVAVGAFDVSCAALGAGVVGTGAVSLSCGSWQAIVVPAAAMPRPVALGESGWSAGAHPGVGGLGLFSLDPNGGVVLDWVARLIGRSLGELEPELVAGDGGPSPVLAVASLADGAKGSLSRLSLATSGRDVVAAVAEAIAYRLVLRLDALRAAGDAPGLVRSSGGGTSSGWWMQLIADLTGLTLEVAAPDAAARGAAALAGLATGVYDSLEAAAELAGVEGRFEPQPERAGRHAARLAEYRESVG